MLRITRSLTFWIPFCVIILILSACQGPVPRLAQPTETPKPTLTPTVTPTITTTPGPQALSVEELQQQCAVLDEQNRQVILQGRIFLPEETITGYKVEDETWLGMNLVTGTQTVVLIHLGEGPNTMDQLPTYFTEKDLVVRAFDNQVIHYGHLVIVTGRPKFKAEGSNQKCEVFADKIETLMDQAVLIPVDRTVREMTDGDNNDECPPEIKNPDIGFLMQLVRLKGALKIDDYVANCTTKNCTVLFDDKTGTLTAIFALGEEPNEMLILPEKPTQKDLVLFNQDGLPVDPGQVVLIGLIQGTSSACEITVYKIE